jgi:hypothetical protein
MCAKSANIEDHSQIARFVSSFIANDFVGKVRTGSLMGVVLPSYAVAGQPKYGFATAWEGKFHVIIFQIPHPNWRNSCAAHCG